MNKRKRERWLVFALIAVFIVAGILLRLHLPPMMHFVATGPQIKAADQLAPFQRAVVSDLDRQRDVVLTYQDGYYIGGEPPANIGVCTDVVARSFRAAGVDLRSAVEIDIRSHPGDYHIAKPDKNIDYRRCRNLAVFFKRHAKMLSTKLQGGDWEPGDIVIFDCTGNGYPNHIAMISNAVGPSGIPMIVHHWPGNPVRMTDDLGNIPVLCHFRWPYKRQVSYATHHASAV